VGPVAHTADAVTGAGTDDSPYEQDCTTDYTVGSTTYCSTPLFPARTLQHLWSNEAVPSYACPDDPANYQPGDDPVNLYAVNLVPGGTTIPWGFGVLGLGPIGMSIVDTIPTDSSGSQADGSGSDPPSSSATNWEIKANSYQIQLYCTVDAGASYQAGADGPGGID
jgi:hypothetical protein